MAKIMKINEIKRVKMLWLLKAVASGGKFCHDDKSREKYCQSADPDDIELCLSCYVGPSCPIKGHRASPSNQDGLLLLRGITDRKIQKLIVAMLNKQRLNQKWSRCVPLFTWDQNLASAAQGNIHKPYGEYDGKQAWKGLRSTRPADL